MQMEMVWLRRTQRSLTLCLQMENAFLLDVLCHEESRSTKEGGGSVVQDCHLEETLEEWDPVAAKNQMVLTPSDILRAGGIDHFTSRPPPKM